MSTLVYSPDIQVHVNTQSSGIIDLSDDIVNFTLTLRENAVHTFQFSLQNAQRKYDGVILPMDVISVKLKRLNWLQAMTGLINEVPIFQAWPGVVNLSASCTMKIPQFWYWDPTSVKALNMMQGAIMGPDSVNSSADKSQKQNDMEAVKGDRNTSKLITESMKQVMGWDPARIHIGQIPRDWFKWSGPVAEAIGADLALYSAIGADFTASGEYSGSSVSGQPGTYAGFTMDKTQANNASIIYSVSKQMKLDSAYAVMALMCALQESKLKNLGNPNVAGSLDLPHEGTGTDHNSVGLFQQQYDQGWGTVQQCQTPATSARTFLRRLKKVVPERTVFAAATAMFGGWVQKVQGSNYPDAYDDWLTVAQKIVASLDKLSGAAAGGAADPRQGTGGGATAGISGSGGMTIGTPNATKGFKASGAQVAVVGLNLIAAHKPPQGKYIHYSMGGDNPADTPIDQVTTLDCSSLIDWCYFNSTGLWLGGTKHQRNNVASIQTHCVQVSLDAAKNIQGAVLTKGANEHTALSTGDGRTCVAAKTDGIELSKQVVGNDPIDNNGFDKGWLLPGVDYSQSATSKVALAELRKVGVNATKLGAQVTAGNTSDQGLTNAGGSPFLSLLNTLVLQSPGYGGLGQTLGGPVALVNDVPFLPWLQTVVNGTLRSFCSAPNGDFIAWFPDYFGAWGTAGKLVLQDIELQDFQVTWSDQQMVTNQFVIGNPGQGMFDQQSGSISFGGVTNDLLSLAMSAMGVASLDYPEIFKLIYGKTAPKGYIEAFRRRFGARPDTAQMPMIPKGANTFFMALYLFIQRWAAQFTATVPTTFMPEVFPGMLIQIPSRGFQAYVQGVVHTGSFGDGGRFETQIQICAPSNIGGADRGDLLSLLPIGAQDVAAADQGNKGQAGQPSGGAKKKSKASGRAI